MASPQNVRMHHPGETLEDHALAAKPAGRPWPKRLFARDFSRDRHSRKASTASFAASVLAVSLASLITIYLLLVCLRHLSRVSSVGESSRVLAGSPPNGEECSGPSGNAGEDGPAGGHLAPAPPAWTLPLMPEAVQHVVQFVLQLLAEAAARFALVAPYLRPGDAQELFRRVALLGAAELSGFAFVPPTLQPLRGRVADRYIAVCEEALGVSSLDPRDGPVSLLLGYIQALGETPDVSITSRPSIYAQVMIMQQGLCHFSTFNVLNQLNELLLSVSPSNGRIPESVVSRTLETLQQLYAARRWQLMRNFLTRFWMHIRQERRRQYFFYGAHLFREALRTPLGPMREELDVLIFAIESGGGVAVTPFPPNNISEISLAIGPAAAAGSAEQQTTGPSHLGEEPPGVPAPAPPSGAHGEAWDPSGDSSGEPSEHIPCVSAQDLHVAAWDASGLLDEKATEHVGLASPQGSYGAAEDQSGHIHGILSHEILSQHSSPAPPHPARDVPGYSHFKPSRPIGSIPHHHAYDEVWDSSGHLHSDPSGHAGPGPPEGAYGEGWGSLGHFYEGPSGHLGPAFPDGADNKAWEPTGYFADEHLESSGAPFSQVADGKGWDASGSFVGVSADFREAAFPQGAYALHWGPPGSFGAEPTGHPQAAPPQYDPTWIEYDYSRPDSSRPAGTASLHGAYGEEEDVPDVTRRAGTPTISHQLSSGSTPPAPGMSAAKSTAFRSSGCIMAAGIDEWLRTGSDGAAAGLEQVLASDRTQPSSRTTDETGTSAGQPGADDDDEDSDGDELLSLIGKAVDWSLVSDEEDGRRCSATPARQQSPVAADP